MTRKWFWVWVRAYLRFTGICAGVLLPGLIGSIPAAEAPTVTSIVLQHNDLVISVEVPAGYRYAVLETSGTVLQTSPSSLVSGSLNGEAGIATFRVPDPSGTQFLRIRVGTDDPLPPATYSGPPYFSMEYSGGSGPLTLEEKAGHVVNRLAYGPHPEELRTVSTLGIAGYIEQQLHPETIDESENSQLQAREADLFLTYQPSEDSDLIAVGEIWRYAKGTQAPPSGWNQVDFNDSGWAEGPSGFGYGDDDDATVLEEMRQSDGNPGYLTLFLRKSFNLNSRSDADGLILRVDFDDGFVAYLNGVEVARANVEQTSYNSRATDDHEAGDPVEYDLTARKPLLRPGANVLAIQVHNTSVTSSDLSLIPQLINRKFLPIAPQKRIKDIESLQQLVHVRGVYSKRQLQTVLAEFWENHFTTDYDKVVDYFADLRNSDAQRAMSRTQAAAEAAQAEFVEYQFFYDHALGNFGDLLLYSATSPSQLIYLDNVLNVKGAPNENYAREILELFAFGVDNRYTQEDIEQLARCFTGWTVRKVWPEDAQPFPASARTPPTETNVQFEDTVLLDLGSGWKYFKGREEPTPGPGGVPTTAWTEPDFDDSTWLNGSTGIGFGDGDDATVLTDMRNRYLSVYLRREFTLSSLEDLDNLLLTVDYDDGFVAYLNGTEIARSRTMSGGDSPPAFNRPANGNHEAGDGEEAYSLERFMNLIRPAPERNVLAIQVHNVDATSSDLSMLPRLVNRVTLPGSIENGNPNGVWTFRFNPEEHDTGAKTIFRGTQYEIKIPAGRTGRDGLQDALEVIDRFVSHPSVSEFICLKLINKFVSDEITLQTYKDGTAPEPLRRLMDDAIAAWHSTSPGGNIETVLRALLRPSSQDGFFWSRAAYRAKIKTPIEFINSSARVLAANIDGTSLPALNDRLGMHLFTRDDPDGWSELGVDWIDTGTMLSRIQFAQALSGNRINGVRWDTAAWVRAHNLSTAESIVDYFNELLFQGKMAPSNRALLIEFATTNDQGQPLPLDPKRNDYANRVRELVGLILSMPQWHYQ